MLLYFCGGGGLAGLLDGVGGPGGSCCVVRHMHIHGYNYIAQKMENLGPKSITDLNTALDTP